MLTTYAFGLQPRSDLKKEIESFVRANTIQAGWIACGVGSLTHYHIRFANQKNGSKGDGHFEIINLMGTASVNFIYTTAEIVIQVSDDFIFEKEREETTGWAELKINPNKFKTK